ncbi:hypothetical protein SK128_001573 [Halocaridina rubra]|uniref:Uncharacterized protein n=1 Tax=Halocaridina rubra TaxID=373956 RepID=A0AAN9AF89_HALRR
MAWNCPCTLQDLVAKVLAKSVIYETESRIQAVISSVPPEVLIARATVYILKSRFTRSTCYEDEDSLDEEECGKDGNEGSSQSPDESDMLTMTAALVKDTLDNVRRWWSTIPKNNGGPRETLEEAFDHYTDVHPREDHDFSRHLTYLLLKLVLLESVFVDRDYGDKDKRCVIPFAWESWVETFISSLAPFENIHELKVYGGMYPNILSEILKGTPNLKSLFISHINITDEILMAASRSCPKLEKLYLLHNFPWQVISMRAFCAAFFKCASKNELVSGYRAGRVRNIRKSFSCLREVELAYGDINVARDFHRLLLFYYNELRTMNCEWKVNVFDDNYAAHSREVLIPVTIKGVKLSLSNVFLECGTIYTMGLEQLHKFAWNCPDVTSLILDCTSSSTPRVSEAEGRHILELVLEWHKLENLHINVNAEHELTIAYLLPTLKTKGPLLRSLTLEAATTSQKLDVGTLSFFLEQCPNLSNLNIRVWKQSMLQTSDKKNKINIPVCQELRELSFHEDGPGDTETIQEEERHRDTWVGFLGALIDASPQLYALSISICRELSSVLDKLSCDVQVLHVHVKSCYEWNPSTEQLRKLVSRLPNLQHLYLEEVRGKTFWKIKHYYRHTGLKVHWGNLHGWPRT